MTRSKDAINPQLVYLDPFLVDRARIALGKSQKDVVQHATPGNRNGSIPALNFRTFRQALRGEGILPASALLVAQSLDRELLELLAPWDPRYVLHKESNGPIAGESEWETVGYLEQGRLAPNGLYYVVCRMQHRHTANRWGRGKFYHLGLVPQAKRESVRHQLSRHADVCARVGTHPHVALNHTSAPAADGWWVIDDWVGEQSLADRLASELWSPEKLPRLLHELAVGLDALHKRQIILRELAPARVLIADRDGRAVLTDFELGKLLNGSPSVSGDWPEDEFRAPEVEGGDFTLQADLYSLGRLAVRCVSEDFPPRDRLPVVLGAASIPKGVAKLLTDCLEPIPDRRPPNLDGLLRELERWVKKHPLGKHHGS
ncbi:MAG: protein kinase [Planctomycetaceae bacterium]|nr:protein kinase [Planctomycetaceae bacterium]